MAVEIEFVSVIVLKCWIAENYPGGLDAYAESSPTLYLEDEHITRVGFMSTMEAENWLDGLGVDSESAALLYTGCTVPTWLACGIHQDRSAAWLANQPAGDVVAMEFLMLADLEGVLSQPNWLERVLGMAEAERTPPSLKPELDASNLVIACQRGLARAEFEVYQKLGVMGLVLPGRRRHLAIDLTLTRDLREAFLQAKVASAK